MVIVFYISGHGFGHATRQLEIIRQVQQRDPGARIVVRSSVPGWFLERSASARIEIQPCETDTGIAQIDSLRIDERATIARAKTFYSTFDDRVTAEAAGLERIGASVVVGDVPPLAFAAAARASIPSVAVANFTWDWIYSGYDAFRSRAPEALAIVGDAYAHTTLALRLPFAGGFETMRQVRDVALVARRSRRSRDENRRLLGMDDRRPIVLASFGGHGAAMPYDRIAETSDITLLVTDYEAKTSRKDSLFDGRLRHFAGTAMERADIRYEDLVAAADVVVSKPGYGIVSECIANHTALLYTTRGAFAENDVIVADMRRVMRSRFIPPDDLRSGRWEPSIRALLSDPDPPQHMPSDGGTEVASAILEVST